MQIAYFPRIWLEFLTSAISLLEHYVFLFGTFDVQLNIQNNPLSIDTKNRSQFVEQDRISFWDW